MLHDLQHILFQHGMPMRVIGAHGAVCDLLRTDGVEAKVGDLDRSATLSKVLGDGRGA